MVMRLDVAYCTVKSSLLSLVEEIDWSIGKACISDGVIGKSTLIKLLLNRLKS